MNIKEKRLAEGKCIFCANPLKTTRLCEAHAATAAMTQRKIVNKRKQADKCVVCGQPKGNSSARTMCEGCQEALKLYAKNDKAARKARGQCRQCQNLIAKDKSKVFCQSCLIKHRKKARKK